ncbi:MAG: metallophosphoesterase [Bacteroidota bacterium]|nr:metallophosphoesterase [Bacteroidota bacterium]MDP4190058.1 metallophosphoesterase [Bacteroidota bacterium]MDP4194962.1 metallophosphoesterase [Bacteroidota bacterium]
MKNFIIFISIILVIYGLINFYIFIRGWQAIPRDSSLRTYYLIIFLVLSISYIAGRALEKNYISPLSSSLIWMGSFWLGMMVYFLLGVIVLDILRLINHFTGIFPDAMERDWQKTKFITAIVLTGIVIITVIAGRINAITPRIYKMNIRVKKHVDSLKTLNIVAASDIHLGTVIGNGRLLYLVNKINSMNPDIILLPGDIVDEDLRPVIKQNLGETLKKLKAKYGVYAITGNHEFYGGVEAATRYLTDHGIEMLRDKTIKINNSIYLIGREDRTLNQVRKRKSLQELMEGVDKNMPLILMDHQPFELDEAVQNGIDLQISGHTHHGQLWPFNFITNRVYEVSWGYKKKGNTNVYVSSGFGGWGPPIRLGNRPEIVNIKLSFE